MQTDDISVRIEAYIESKLPGILEKVKGRTNDLADTSHFSFYRLSSSIAGDAAGDLLSEMIPAFGYNGSVRDLRHRLQIMLMAEMERHIEEYGMYKEPQSTVIMKKGLLEKMRSAGDEIIDKRGKVSNREITLQIGLQPTREEVSFVRGQTLTHYKGWSWKKIVESGVTVYKHSCIV
ncbi:MAG TPA: hypothetical protein VJG30_03250 [Candidatus Nanoarchaeia archaeon]|nr:hypothetical protein [Candidatus Nanoarchaeia archaeon]